VRSKKYNAKTNTIGQVGNRQLLVRRAPARWAGSPPRYCVNRAGDVRTAWTLTALSADVLGKLSRPESGRPRPVEACVGRVCGLHVAGGATTVLFLPLPLSRARSTLPMLHTPSRCEEGLQTFALLPLMYFSAD
jgi:hypothetical protein